MIKWLSASRSRTATENESPGPLTNDPLAAIAHISSPGAKCHIYAVSRVNPLFKEEIEAEGEETVASLNSPDSTSGSRSSPRKSVSSGYESRCNSSSDSSSCTECEENQIKKSREKRLTKQSKAEKKKRVDKWDECPNSNALNEGSENFKRKPKKPTNGSPPGSSNLSPIPEGKIDCSIPPPIWPRCEENCTEKRSLETQELGGGFHNGSTNPLNFMFRYNEKYPKCCSGPGRNLFNHDVSCGGVPTEYEHNWVECRRNYDKDSGKSGGDSGKGYTPESTLERIPVNKSELTQEVLRDLAGLVAYAMNKKGTVSIDSILKNLVDSIQKCLEILSQTESEDNLRNVYENLNRNKYLNRMWTNLVHRESILSITGEGIKNGVNTAELTLELQKLKNREANLTDEIYSSGSEGKNSSSSSSGCKDLYLSSNSSSAGKESASSFELVRVKEAPLGDVRNVPVQEKTQTSEKISVLGLIHHQRDLSSSSSAESAFGFSDGSPTPSDSSSAKGVLNPVFLHENIYSIPTSMQNAIICESFSRTKGPIGDSIRNCGSSAFEKLINAKRRTSSATLVEELGALTFADEEKSCLPTMMTAAKMDKIILKKIEHPYYVAMGRPDFTLDMPQAEQLMKKIASSKRRRCWCRLTTSILGLVFFLLSVMMVSLIITKGRRMFGAM